MNQFEEYKKKYGHLSSDEKEMRRKFYTYLDEQNMMLEAITASSSSAVSGGVGGGERPRSVPNFSTGQFITSWKTDNAGTSGSTQIQLPLVQNGDYYFQVSWGDGNVDIIQSWDQKEATHTYATAGTYTVTIGGTFKGFIFNNGRDRLKLLTVSQWGTSFVIQSGSFSGCSNMTISATDLPIVENLNGSFYACSSMVTVPNMNSWDISNAVDMGGCFALCTLFNTNIGNWNTGNVTSMSGTFNGASAFNQPIGTWNTSKVAYMGFMFTNANAFNQNIGAWDTSNVLYMSAMFNPTTAFNNGGSPDINNWNTSKVLDFNIMFRSAASFNQPIGNWNVSSTLSLRSMFRDSAFRQNVDNWRPVNCTNFTDIFLNLGGFNPNVPNWTVSKGTSFSRIFQSTSADFSLAAWDVSGAFNLDLGGGFSSTNYSAGLIAWAALPSLQRNVFLRVGGQYTSAAASARAFLISAYNWTIVDSGLAP
jgi:surface protein